MNGHIFSQRRKLRVTASRLFSKSGGARPRHCVAHEHKMPLQRKPQRRSSQALYRNKIASALSQRYRLVTQSVWATATGKRFTLWATWTQAIPSNSTSLA